MGFEIHDSNQFISCVAIGVANRAEMTEPIHWAAKELREPIPSECRPLFDSAATDRLDQP